MAKVAVPPSKEERKKFRLSRRIGFCCPIGTKLALSFLSIIILSSLIFTLVGVQVISDRILAEAQERVRTDLNSARLIYQDRLEQVVQATQFTTARLFLKDILQGTAEAEYLEELSRFRESENLDILTITDHTGKVVFRTTNPDNVGDDQSNDEIVGAVLRSGKSVAGTTIISADELAKESPALAEQAYFRFIETPLARERPETEETAGMMLKAAAPVINEEGTLIGVVYCGVLLNHNYEIVDKIKQTVFQGVLYSGKDIGTATIFQDDVRVSTNVMNADGSRAVGTRISEEVYNQVVLNGEPWIGRAYVVNDWYITSYEPITSIYGEIIGILYVGILEQKYVDIEQRTVLVFLGIALAGVALSIFLSLYLSSIISGPIRKMVTASKQLANGDLDVKVAIKSQDEFGELANTFNSMASALKERDEQLKEYTKSKIMESERLAIIGQLAANVAHEINNPLQGIVTYSHLLLETMPNEEWSRGNLEKIVTQANRCRDIIRGLLDFARQRKIEKRLYNVNNVIKECVSLLENQALFQNIQIIKKLDPKLPEIVFDPSQVERVFLNIIINAAEAMEGNGKLVLATRFNSVERMVEIAFSDTGPGISKENMEKVFSPFFTTKDVGHGVGLGLAISYGIVKEHKGTITVESKVGKGTTFTVKLPMIKDESNDRDGK